MSNSKENKFIEFLVFWGSFWWVDVIFLADLYLTNFNPFSSFKCSTFHWKWNSRDAHSPWNGLCDVFWYIRHKAQWNRAKIVRYLPNLAKSWEIGHWKQAIVHLLEVAWAWILVVISDAQVSRISPSKGFWKCIKTGD